MESLDGDRLRERLASHPLPRSSIAPALSYGRHRGPAPCGARIAAVAVTLYQTADGSWTIPLTLRPSGLQHHAGQVCLPGGQVEASEDVYSAALREFEEELGLAPQVICRCGELTTQYVYASDNLVHPVVAIIECPIQPWKPDPLEVETVIPLPLGLLRDPGCRRQMIQSRSVRLGHGEIDRFSFRATAFQYQDYMIWGATALILDQLARILHQLD